MIHFTRICIRNGFCGALAVAVVLLLLAPATVGAATALLVNTESFQTIDSGDGATNIELRFGSSTQTLKFLTTNKFQFSRGLSVQGNLSGASLRIDGGADIWGTLGVSGATVLKSTATINGATKVRGNLSGASLRIDGGADIWGNLGVSGSTVLKGNVNIRNSGTLNASGSILTNSDATINSDRGAVDATFTFGNATTNQTIIYSHANQRFEFSKDLKVTGGVRVTGNLSGSTLNVDGNTILRGTTYQWPTSQGGANTFLKNDGAGALSWTSTSVGPSSGNILSLHPEYRSAVYTQSGSTAVGQLTSSGALGFDNLYRWTTTKGTLQDYWIGVRVQVPKNFTHFTGSGGIQLRLRTATANAAENYATLRVLDSNNANVAVTNNAQLVNSAANIWRTVNIGNVSAGTYTAGSYVTVLIKVAATSAGYTDLGFLNFNWSNSTP
ncbi:MAG: hypothetical protein HOO67_07455 [Candidatus Peribacteraceae bacterium]|nr:hypothetical protein [Candidatus Peribacteraceae bacterium]